MKLELIEDQRAMVETVRQLANGKFKARVKKWQDGTFPFENIKDLADIGVLGMAVQPEFGGLGLPVLDCVLVLEEIAKVCYVTAMAVMSAMGAQNRIIANFAPKHVQEKFLPGVVTGEVILVDPRPGHVPGARNAPWAAVLGTDGRLRPPAELRAHFAALGVTPENSAEAVAYCGSGVSACANLVAMEHAGIAPARLYVASWSGWSADPARPAELGPGATTE